MKKLLYVLSLLIIASMVLTACGGAAPTEAPSAATEAPSAATEAPSAATEAPAASGDKVQIRWYIGLGTGANNEQVPTEQEVVDDFNATHPNIELVMEVVTNEAARDTLATEIASGNGPDVIGPVGW